MTEHNIKRRWRATGIYLKNRQVPLGFRFCEKAPETLEEDCHDPNPSLRLTNPNIELRRLLGDIPMNAAQRHTVRKIGKALDVERVPNTIKSKRIEDLEHQLEDLKGRKQRKVEPQDPNVRFATGHEVIMTEEAMEAEARIK